MKELKLERDTIKLLLYGKEFIIQMPTLGMAQEWARKLKEDSKEDTTELMYEYLASLGLPKEESCKLQVDHLELLVNELMPSKKK